MFPRGKSSPTLEHLTRLHLPVHVLIFERVKVAQYLRVFKRYRRKLLFMGRMHVPGILLTGLSGYWFLLNTRYHSLIDDGLMSLVSNAKLGDEPFRIVDWFQKKGRLNILITRELAKPGPEHFH